MGPVGDRPVIPAWVTSKEQTGKQVFHLSKCPMASQIYRYQEGLFPLNFFPHFFPPTPNRSVPGYSRAQGACHPLKSFLDGTKTRGGRVGHGRCTINIREHQRLEQPLHWLYIVIVAEVMGSGRLDNQKVIISVAIYETCPTTNSRYLRAAVAAVAWVYLGPIPQGVQSSRAPAHADSEAAAAVAASMTKRSSLAASEVERGPVLHDGAVGALASGSCSGAR